MGSVMAHEAVTQKLTVILYADVAGYSRLTGADELGTHQRLSAALDLVSDTIRARNGRVVHYAGDAVLAEFGSVVAAVECAVSIQRDIAGRNSDVPADRRLEFRIGVNLGEVIVDRDDIYGDGVNVAARLESLADDGGICVSGKVFEEVRNKLDLAFEDLGDQEVKNIAAPVRAYRVILDDAATGAAEAPPRRDRGSIAVLPFVNLSGDPEQEYFADGITEDIIMALSNVRTFTVLARNSTFVYKGRAVDAKRVGRELGVHYLVEGSVRKSGNRIRVTAQLIESASGDHVWAERYDGTLDDIFDLQDQITGTIVGTIEPELHRAEAERIKQKRPDSMDAYDYLLRGLAYMNKLTPEDTQEALRYFRKAIELDPNYSRAYADAAWCYRREVQLGGLTLPDEEKAEAIELMQKALELDKNDPVVLWQAGAFKVHFRQDLDDAAALIDRSLAINPNSSRAWTASAQCRGYMGDTATSIRHAERAMAISPRHPSQWVVHWCIARAHLQEKRYEEAARFAKTALQIHERTAPVYHILAAAFAHLGRMDEARAAEASARELDPELTISRLQAIYPVARMKNLDAFLDGLRKAGLPE
ncbi:MAG: adenylate/guanylate cyclase domain-containing protein [Alphaproteobacteria bacterium]